CLGPIGQIGAGSGEGTPRCQRVPHGNHGPCGHFGGNFGFEARPAMKRILPVLMALPLVIAFGVAEGQWTDRWSMSDEIEQASARLRSIPTTAGEWEGTDEELDPRQAA